MSDNTSLYSHLIVLELTEPARGWLMAYSYTLPTISGRQVQIGDRISFGAAGIEPPSVDYFLPQLPALRFVD
jgi:hypothetical protein